jgi:hypothetical protein
VLAALSGAKPAADAAPPGSETAANVHRHPSTQPAERRAAV